MKSKKFNLNELKVKSFVTEFRSGKEDTVKGGGFTRSLFKKCGGGNDPTLGSCPGPCGATIVDCTTIEESDACTDNGSNCCN